MATKRSTRTRGAVPNPEHEARFWRMIEDAWSGREKKANTLRTKLARRDPDDEDDEPDITAVDAALPDVIDALEQAAAKLTREELTDLDRVLERKLYEIDRADVQERTDGSDDGFLYCRGFIVALGREYYAAVAANPALAVMDAECEAMCYLFAHACEKRYGAFPETRSGISRESGSNPKGWPK